MSIGIKHYLWRESRVLIHQLHHSWCLLILSSSSPTTSAFPTSIHLQLPWFALNDMKPPNCEPLPSLEGCGLDQQLLSSLRSEDTTVAAPPLSKGMWVAFYCSSGASNNKPPPPSPSPLHSHHNNDHNNSGWPQWQPQQMTGGYSEGNDGDNNEGSNIEDDNAGSNSEDDSDDNDSR